MLDIILVRHGETAGNLRPTALGTTDLELNERGRRQAQSLARVFKLEKPDVIYTSPLSRASETANAIAREHGMNPEPMLDLCERNFGRWENLPVDEIRVRFEEAYSAWQEDIVNYQIPGGESAREHNERLVRMMGDIIRRHQGEKVMLVTHLGCIRHLLAYLLGMGIEGSWRFSLKPGTFCRLQVDEKGFGVLSSLGEF